MKIFTSLLFVLVIPSFAPAAFAADNLVIQWNNAGLRAVRETKFGPPMTARALSILHTCIFDAWAAYDKRAVGTQLGGSLRRPTEERTPENTNKAISFAAYRALVDLFASKKSVFDALMNQLGYDPNDNTLDTSTPQGIGNAACNAVLAVRHADGSNQLGDLHAGAYSDYTGYTPANTIDQLNDPNSWQPLRVPDGLGGFRNQGYLAPHWGNVTPFALNSGADVRPPGGAFRYFAAPANAAERQANRRFLQQAKDILRKSAQLNDRTKMIAEYWSDGPASETPPGHWCLLGQFVSRRDRHSLASDVKMFFMLTAAVFDAGIASWDTKRAYDSVRPITAIRFLFGGQKVRAWGGPFQGTKLINGAHWQPYQAATFVTPPFPEFTSGHSTFSSAAATVLRLFTKSDRFGMRVVLPAGSSALEPGEVPRRLVQLYWRTFTEAATQAGESRLIGGIHFQRANLEGRKAGSIVGNLVWIKAQSYIRGTAD